MAFPKRDINRLKKQFRAAAVPDKLMVCSRAQNIGPFMFMQQLQAKQVLGLQSWPGHAREVGMDASLHADLCCPSVPGLCCASSDFRHGQQVGWASQVLCNLAFAEGAKLTGVDAPVGIIDVTVHGVGDPAGTST